MPRVILVHGAFHELWGPNELLTRWLPAVRDGLWHHDATLDADDVDVCFYGDLFRLDLESIDVDAWEQSRAGAVEMLDAIGGEEGLGFLSQAAGNAAYDRTVDMVTIMTGDDSIRDRTRARLLDAIDGDTCVVVAHSLGSVIAHQTLAANPTIEIDTLITLGSPLGSEMIFPSLEPTTEGEFGPWPGSTKRWVNVAAHGDKAAAVSELATKFGPDVEDHLIDNGYRAHDALPYLNSSVTGAAIGRALAPFEA
jgi:pimeloyl-ACP methyl ester carboxylesterase